MLSSVFLAALVVRSMASPEPNGWSSVPSASDGPNKLDECGCEPIYKTMLRCQKVKGVNSGIQECVCIKNPDGWYGWMDKCRTCLSSGSDEDFFNNLSRTITQLFVSCTEVGGGITSDGESICASNAYFEGCAALKTDGKPSWASFETFASTAAFDAGERSNGTYVLDISDDQESASTTSSGSETATITRTESETSNTSTTSGTTTTETEPSATDGSRTATEASVTPASGTTAATSPSITATTTPSSAMGYTGSRSQAEHLAALLFLAALGVAFV
ncbi:hypothetical protein VTH82DRAFT_1375 [Thermothelomyces myriococcoides]